VTRTLRGGGSFRRRLRLWAGLERNALCRPCDRVQARVRVLLVVVFLLTAPLAAAGAAAAVYRASAHAEAVERSSRVRVDAVLLADARPVGGAFAAVPRIPVLARWTAADGSPRTGAILVSTTAPAGTVVPIWTDRAGNVAEPPRDHEQTTMRASVAAMVVGSTVALLLAAVQVTVRRTLNRRRMAAWDAEWSRVAPRWQEYH
jgi:hypothetical protein